MSEPSAFRFGGAPPSLHAGGCLNRRHRDAGCTQCVDTCPTAAIVLVDSTPTLDASACARCGACEAACPVDAFARDSAEDRLLRTVSSLPTGPTTVVCSRHATPDRSPTPAPQIVKHGQCLAALSVAGLLRLGEGGRRALWLDDSPCRACPLGAVHAALRHTTGSANALLAAWGRPETIHLAGEEDTPAAGPRRPVVDGNQPPLSRRSLLMRLVPAQAVTGRPQPPAAGDESPLQESIPDSRRRTLQELRTLPLPEPGAQPAGQLPFATVQVDETRCSACGLCARICPTAALSLQTDRTGYCLEFAAAACIDCGICATACPEEAITLADAFEPADLVAGTSQTLATGAMSTCVDCGAPTAARQGESSRCYACRQGAGVVRPLRDDAGLMADLLARSARVLAQ